MAASAACAHQPLITDDSGTQGTGGNQLELALERDRIDRAGVTDTTRTLPVTFMHGLSDTLDVFASISHISSRSGFPAVDASGGGNPVLGLKWRFYDNASSKTSVAIKPQYVLPTSSAGEASGLGSGRASYGMTAILTQETGFGAIHANLLAGSTRYRDTTTNPDALLFQASIASVWQLGEAWKLALDVGGKTTRTASGRNRADYIEIGGVYSPDKDCDFAFGIIGGTDHALTAGITWRFR
ncbi:MAG: transporter [Proteobacteria bacterium]|nr:transporter [Pseudomonadota bacterium]